MTKATIAYYRVSTPGQGRSGLGLEAQAADVARFNAAFGHEQIDAFVEIETGKGNDALKTRPQLAAAIELARLTGATIVVAKLDRLTRDVEFGAGLFNRVDLAFKCADMPHANNFMLNIMLAVAQQEREMISDRTKKALAAAKARGQQLGQPIGNVMQAGRAVAFAEGLRAIVAPLAGQSLRAIAAHLNAAGTLTATGALWSAPTVLRLMNRLEIA